MGWFVGALFVVGGYLLAWVRAAPPPPAESNYSRLGAVVIVTVIPVVLAAIQTVRSDFDGTAIYLVPVLTSLFISATALVAGFLPDDPTGCAFLAQFGDSDPTCATSTAARTGTFLESIGMWVVFGAVAVTAQVLRNRARERREA